MNQDDRLNEDDGLLGSPTRPPRISLSTHTSIPSEEEDTDPDIDNDDLHYDVYATSKAPDDTKRRNIIKDGKSFHSLVAPTETDATPKSQYLHRQRKFIKSRQWWLFFFLCCIIWCVITIGLGIFLYFYLQPEITPPPTNAKLIEITPGIYCPSSFYKPSFHKLYYINYTLKYPQLNQLWNLHWNLHWNRHSSLHCIHH